MTDHKTTSEQSVVDLACDLVDAFYGQGRGPSCVDARWIQVARFVLDHFQPGGCAT